jgi:hypothetical protein
MKLIFNNSFSYNSPIYFFQTIQSKQPIFSKQKIQIVQQILFYFCTGNIKDYMGRFYAVKKRSKLIRYYPLKNH